LGPSELEAAARRLAADFALARQQAGISLAVAVKLIHRRRRIDGNHTAIVKALKDAGCGVADLSAIGKGCPDLLVHGPVAPWSMWLIEVKDPTTRRGREGLNEEQQAFFNAWKGNKAVVTSVDVPVNFRALRIVAISLVLGPAKESSSMMTMSSLAIRLAMAICVARWIAFFGSR